MYVLHGTLICHPLITGWMDPTDLGISEGTCGDCKTSAGEECRPQLCRYGGYLHNITMSFGDMCLCGICGLYV